MCNAGEGVDQVFHEDEYAHFVYPKILLKRPVNDEEEYDQAAKSQQEAEEFLDDVRDGHDQLAEPLHPLKHNDEYHDILYHNYRSVVFECVITSIILHECVRSVDCILFLFTV